jgi:hypothetical protein
MSESTTLPETDPDEQRLRLVDCRWDTILENAVAADHSSLRIVCPFIKERTAMRLFGSQKAKTVQVITRFNLADFGEGVSDIAALRLLLENGAQIRGIRGLHAKLYLIGRCAIVTSANLTEAALSRNHELGFVSTDCDIIRRCNEYFDKLWPQAGADLTVGLLDAWEKQIADALAFRHRPTSTTGLGDHGAVVVMPGSPVTATRGEPQIGEDELIRWAEAPQAFVKFFGESTNRADRDNSILDEVKRSGCHWACTYPKGKRPRQVEDNAVMFMGRLARDPADILIFGRAVAMRHREGQDDATMEDIAKRAWKAKWPHYVRVHHAEFVAGTLGNGISLNKLMDELGPDAFAVTQRNAAGGQGNTDPRRAYRRQAAVELSREGLDWLNARIQGAFDEHGRLGPDDFAQLDWPEMPASVVSDAEGIGSGQEPDIRGTVYERLKQAARANAPVTYGEIAALIGLDTSRGDHRDQIAELLGEISESEHKLGRPMLSVVAVHSEQGAPTGTPGKGFFTLAKRLGLQRNEDDVTFFIRELARAHAAWKQ